MGCPGTEPMADSFAQACENKPALPGLDEAYARTGCTIDRKIRPSGSPAVYVPFMYRPGKDSPSFVNTMLVDLGRDEHKIKISKRHEAIHAVQWNSVPALHASPYNPASRIVLSPESWVMMTLLTERDAFVKTAWLNALDIAQGETPQFLAQAATETVTPADIDLQTSDLRAAIQNAATCWDGRFRHQYPGETERVTFLDHYIRQALSSYEHGHGLRDAADGPLVYIRLAPEDVLAIGSSFGPSTFGEGAADSVFTQLPLMPPDLWERLQELNRRHGILCESALPTLSQALSAMNRTPKSYMEASKSHIPTPAQLLECVV